MRFILGNFHSSYKDRLIKLKLLPLSLSFEYLHILFLIKCVNSRCHFNIFKFIQFVCSSTRSSTHVKLKSLIPLVSKIHLNFTVKLWNALPVSDISLSMSESQHKMKIFLWSCFLNHFDSDIVCTGHYHNSSKFVPPISKINNYLSGLHQISLQLFVCKI